MSGSDTTQQTAQAQASPMNSSSQAAPTDDFLAQLQYNQAMTGVMNNGGVIPSVPTTQQPAQQQTAAPGLLNINLQPTTTQQAGPDYQSMAAQNYLQSQNRVNNALTNNPMGSVRPWFTPTQSNGG